MYITTPKRKGGITVVRIVESYRRNGKVKNRILKTVGQSRDLEKIKHFKLTAKNLIEEHKKHNPFQKPEFLPVNLSLLLGHKRHNKGFEDILGASYESLGFSNLISTGKDNQTLNERLKSMVLMRVFQPSSKLRSCYLLDQHFNQKLSHKQVLTMMDHLSNSEKQIKKKMFSSALKGRKNLSLLLFDVTTLYFESNKADELREFGYSKDGKFNEVQLVLAVLSDEQGLPLCYELFPGNEPETNTIRCVLKAFVDDHKVKRLKVVADRGLFSENNFSFIEQLEKDLKIKIEYVLSCPLKKLPGEMKQKILKFRSSEIKKIENNPSSTSSNCCEFLYKGRRVIVSYSEKARKRDEAKRRKIVDKLQSISRDGKIASSRLVKNTGLRRYVKTIKGSIEIDTQKIFQDSLWDGVYGICSNEEEKDPHKLLKSYRCLWRIEELFRINKHTLSMRPIYHRLSKRIKAHILICFLAYTVLKQTQITLKKARLSFSLNEVIDILKQVEVFKLRDNRTNGNSYIMPVELSKQAYQIYSAFKQQFLQSTSLLKKT